MTDILRWAALLGALAVACVLVAAAEADDYDDWRWSEFVRLSRWWRRDA
jgi:hypothetical protein